MLDWALRAQHFVIGCGRFELVLHPVTARLKFAEGFWRSSFALPAYWFCAMPFFHRAIVPHA